MRRELRGSQARVLFFVACLAVGVGAVVAVAGLADSVQGAVSAKRGRCSPPTWRSGRRPLPTVVDDAPAEWVTGTARLRLFTTMVSAVHERAGAAERSLVELKAVSGDYPFYGD